MNVLDMLPSSLLAVKQCSPNGLLAFKNGILRSRAYTSSDSLIPVQKGPPSTLFLVVVQGDQGESDEQSNEE